MRSATGRTEVKRHWRIQRTGAGFTQRDLAIEARIPYTRFRDIEGGYSDPTEEELDRLAAALDVSKEFLRAPYETDVAIVSGSAAAERTA